MLAELRRCTRIIGLLGILALAGLLQACGATKVFYNQAPDYFAYWYLDGHFDFTEAQSLQVKDGLTQLQAWHRQTQLPGYIDALQKLQRQMPSDMDAGTACALFADLRRKLIAVADQAEPAAAAVVGTLGADQLVQLERRFALGNAHFQGDFLEGTLKEVRDKRFQQAVSRAEMLYGPLDDMQLAVIGRRIDQSRFDATLSYAERLRRQQDALQTLRPLIAGQATPETTQAALHGLFERRRNSPDPVYRDYRNQLTQEACETFADLHNSTTAAQRSSAVETLNGYEQDFRALNAQQPLRACHAAGAGIGVVSPAARPTSPCHARPSRYAGS
ncbi:MAG: DUF6279 family lipoprotein [Polaromonas sp.]